MNEKISLIIPVYNAEQYLQPCLDSVLAQTIFPDVQVLLIDDGSSDASGQICDVYASKYANITAVHRPNGGVSVARNAGLELATGEYLAFADADDLLMPQMLEKLYTAAKRTGADLAFCGFEHPYPDQNVTILYPFPENTAMDFDEILHTIVPFMIKDEAFNALWNKIFSRAFVTQLQLTFTPGKKYAEDREFILQYLRVCMCACYVPYVGYYYRYVETGAIQQPRRDYGVRIVEQYRSDLRQFSALGIPPTSFRQKSAACQAGKIVGALGFAENKLRGSARRATIASIVENRKLQWLLRQIWDDAMPELTRFNRILLRQVRRKSIFGVRLYFWILRVRVGLHDRNGGKKIDG